MGFNLKAFAGKLNKKELLIVLLIFILAFGVRAHLMRYELMFEFDTYYHARMTSYVIQGLGLPAKDPLAYYQLTAPDFPSQGAFFFYLCAALYKIFFLGAAYDKWLLIGLAKFLPAFFGALTSVAMYYLGKSMYSRKAGITMGFFAAVVPAFVYRTMAGFFESDSLGFLWLVMGFVFFVRAVKEMEFSRKSVINALISGIFFAIMAWTWEMFLLIPMVIVAYFAITLVVGWFRGVEKGKLLDFAKLFAISIVVFSMLASSVVGTQWINRTFDYVTQYLPVTAENIQHAQSRDPNVLGMTVGEENIGIKFFASKYNALIVFPFIAFLLIPYKLLRDRKAHLGIIIFVWAAITLYMAASKLKFTYTLGLPIAACAGFVFNELFIFQKSRTPFERMSISAVMCFMLMVGVGAATYFVTQQPPNIEVTPGWKEALDWMQKETPEDARFFNWWDEGHWITFMGERRASADNRNVDGYANMDMGRFSITDSEEEAYELTQKRYKADYVILSSDMISKLSSMAMYAYDTIDTSDPRLQGYFAVAMPCRGDVDALTGAVTYNCGGNTFAEADMQRIPAGWTSAPNMKITERLPGMIYREENNSVLYVANPQANNTMTVRMWMRDPAIKHFEEVFSAGEVRIYKTVK